jgi:hypothetical protein
VTMHTAGSDIHHDPTTQRRLRSSSTVPPISEGHRAGMPGVSAAASSLVTARLLGNVQAADPSRARSGRCLALGPRGDRSARSHDALPSRFAWTSAPPELPDRLDTRSVQDLVCGGSNEICRGLRGRRLGSLDCASTGSVGDPTPTVGVPEPPRPAIGPLRECD